MLSSSKFGSKLKVVAVFTAVSLVRDELREVGGGELPFLLLLLREIKECAQDLTFRGFLEGAPHFEESYSFVCSLKDVGESGGDTDKDGSEALSGSCE